jgi:PAS domain S-box-containing protein
LNKLVNILQIEKRHLLIIFFAAIIILISANIVFYMNMQDLSEYEKNTSRAFINLEIIEKLRDDISDAETGANFYHITGDNKYLQTYRTLASSIDTIYNKLRYNNEISPNQKYYLDTLSMLIKQRFHLLNRGMNLQEKSRNAQLLYKQLENEGKEVREKIIATVMGMKDEERNTLNRRLEMSGSKAEFTLLIVTGSTLLSIIILIFTFVLIRKAAPDNYFYELSRRSSEDELESIVRDRTAEISQINRRLYKTIDDYKRSQTALQQSEKDYRTLFEHAHDAIMIFDPENENILEVNKRACQVYKISREHFIGLTLKSLSKNIPEGEKRIKLTLEKGYDYNFQSVHYKNDGTEMLMEINASVINYKGKTAILSINRDITDRILSYIPLPGS